MTPEREAYLAKCGMREYQIRVLIRSYKHELKKNKAVCSSYDLKQIGRKPFGYNLSIGSVKGDKIIITALRRELARIKGMDRVAMPYEVYDKSTDLDDWYCSNCDREVSVFEGYCPNCGRHILWEKVK